MVSVIIPVYNGEEFLEACLHSVMDQTYRNLEIIVIDDGSTDKSCKIYSALAKSDNRIKVIWQENAGVSAARNTGMSAAAGKYIMFVDADDLLPCRAVELLVQDIISTGSDMSIGAYSHFRLGIKEALPIRTKRYCIQELREDIALSEALLPTLWRRIYRREIIVNNHLKFVENVPYGEDTLFNLEFCAHINMVSVFDEVVYYYRLGGPASSTKFYPNQADLTINLLNAYFVFFQNENVLQNEAFSILVRNNLLGTCVHYIAYLTHSKAVAAIENTLEVYRKYLNKSIISDKLYGRKAKLILDGNSSKLYFRILLENIQTILMKRAKRLYYRYFSKRI